MAKKKTRKAEADEETSEIKIEDISSEAEPEDLEEAGERADQGKAADPGKDAGKTKEGSESEAGQEDQDKKDDEQSEADKAWTEKYLRLMADFENFRMRTEKEKAEVYSFANEKIMTDMLPVIDNFERALEVECQDQAYVDGVQMIFKQLTDILKKSGLEEIEALGHDFDPNFHHAVLTDSNPDFDSGMVTEVLQKGYTMNGKVIRPAMVKVNA